MKKALRKIWKKSIQQKTRKKQPDFSCKLVDSCFHCDLGGEATCYLFYLKRVSLFRMWLSLLFVLACSATLRVDARSLDCPPIECDWPNCPDGAIPETQPGDCCPSCPGERDSHTRSENLRFLLHNENETEERALCSCLFDRFASYGFIIRLLFPFVRFETHFI